MRLNEINLYLMYTNGHINDVMDFEARDYGLYSCFMFHFQVHVFKRCFSRILADASRYVQNSDAISGNVFKSNDISYFI